LYHSEEGKGSGKTTCTQGTRAGFPANFDGVRILRFLLDAPLGSLDILGEL
jgi:hypothetical protein